MSLGTAKTIHWFECQFNQNEEKLRLIMHKKKHFNTISLFRYLQEVGYTDTILDVKSQRVKALLGLTGDGVERAGERRTEPMVNGTEPSSLKESTTNMMG